MIKEVSALKTVPSRLGNIIKKKPNTTIEAAHNGLDPVLSDKLSYVIHADKTDVIDPFTREHFDYLRYIGVKD